VLNGLEPTGPYFVHSDDPEQARYDLKRPWMPSPSGASRPASVCMIFGTLKRYESQPSIQLAG
jgi:hypothetical protein